MRLKPQTYALTSATAERRPLFQNPERAELLLAVIYRNRDAGKILVHGFAVMPDHIHLLLTPRESIERAAQLVKGGFSFEFRKQYRWEVWQTGYHAHSILDEQDFVNQQQYIANNPLRRGWQDYPYVHTSGRWPLDECSLYPRG